MSEATLDLVVQKQITELETLLFAKGIDLTVTPAARAWLAQRGYDRRLGARPLARLIQDEVKRPLADEILFGSLENGGHVELTVESPGEIRSDGGGELGIPVNSVAMPASAEPKLVFRLKSRDGKLVEARAVSS
jgi:ATP-dependent Clp protease ATP-binding subunit ClpA